jgi:hypothetical protein
MKIRYRRSAVSLSAVLALLVGSIIGLTSTALAAPAPPANVTGTANSDGSVTVNWTPVAGATAYAVWAYGYNGANAPSVPEVLFGTTFTYPSSVLSSGATYVFTAIAYSGGWGSWAAWSGYVTTTIPQTGGSPLSRADVQLAITELAAHPPKFGKIVAGFPNDPSGSDPINMGGSINMFFLALDGYLSGGQNTASSQAAIGALNNILIPGNGPDATEPLYYWSGGPLSAAIALLDKTPGDPLAAAGIKANAELLLTAEAMGANGNWNSGNCGSLKADIGNLQRGDASPGVSTSIRTWKCGRNPNYLGGPVAVMACAIAFTPAGCDAKFTSFNYASFTAQLNAAGMTNITAAWGNNASKIQGYIAKAWNFQGHNISDYNGTFEAMSVSGWPTGPAFTSAAIQSGNASCQGAHTINNPTGNPVLGQPGQIGEFNSSDTKGCRSDALYAYEAGSHQVYGAALLKATGNWAPIGNTVSYFHNGETDLFYKIDNGYYGYGYGAQRTVYPDQPTAPAFWPGAPAWDTDNPNTKGYHSERALFSWEGI